MKTDKIICPVEKTLEIIGGSWKVRILSELFTGTKRFNELKKCVNGITQKMLTQQLRDLENQGIINRKVYAVVPPKVEYSLTDLGISLKPILDAIHEWGKSHL
ncbi:MAG: transcriptional regulator [Candidatus Acididesulfobacter guangdongensis]|uniref:Transcriptional regulator n=1 Tax=Acididesulfobacter guangdongensis TaxID=2597225 RepID=A0A519BGA6_ACIG2|nr:MAG: transcriptional regulator [Candidatus Acididesulfobacter guangdongensis]